MNKIMYFAAALILCSCSDSFDEFSGEITRTIEHNHVPVSERLDQIKESGMYFSRYNVVDYEIIDSVIVMHYDDVDAFDFSYNCWCGESDGKIDLPVDFSSLELYLSGEEYGYVMWCCECDVFHIHFNNYTYTDASLDESFD